MNAENTAAAGSSTAENPWPVRTVATKVAAWIDRLGSVWVEGEITQINARPGTRVAFLVLRDPSANMSLSVTCSPQILDAAPIELTEGTRVIMYGKLSFHTARGTVSLRASAIRAVGVGELLARIERLRNLLAAEGLFDPRLKRPLPFLPGVIGLITGRASDAERDVVSVAQKRWPAVQFKIINTPVQGPTAVPAILKALTALDADATVNVIILARGGGSVEDLLPFSDEALCRAIVAVTTPVVSAIGHEPNSPLSDHVADFRAATPTDAAKHVVPDAIAEQALVRELRARTAAALRNWVDRESKGLAMIRHRPVLADPIAALDARADDIERAIGHARREVMHQLAKQDSLIEHLHARVGALGPAATLARGYAVVQRVVPGGPPEVLRSVEDAPPGTQIRVRVADGAVTAAVMGRVK